MNDSGDMTKKKVMYFGDAQSVHVQRWANYFAEKGWEMHLITYKLEEKALHRDVVQHLIRPIRIPKVRVPGLVRITVLLQLLKKIREIKPDLIHTHSIPGYGDYMGICSKFVKLPQVIITPWGFSHIRENQNRKMRWWFDKITLENATFVTSQSFHMKNELIKHYDIAETKFEIFHWGIDLNHFHQNYNTEMLRKQLEIPDDTFIVLSPRAMAPFYNIHNIIQAAKEVLIKHDAVIFLFLRGYGHEGFEVEMKKLALDLRTSKNMRFVDSLVSYGIMPQYYNLADIAIMIPWTDNASLSLIECMACGCIPIATDIETNREWINEGKNGFLVAPENPKIIADRINYCIEHPEIKEEFYKTNKLLVIEKADWNKNTKKMEELYQSIIYNTTGE